MIEKAVRRIAGALRLGSARRRTPDAGQLNFYPEAWPLLADVCPCDSDLVAYLLENNTGGANIFHFGTGEHHLLGRENLKLPVPNEILAITASPEEHDRYVDFIIENPHAARYYKVLFADIYTLTPRLLPSFDIVTLFHICEFYNESNAKYASLDDTSLLDLFIRKVNPGGKVVFYSGSLGFDRAAAVIESSVAAGQLRQAEEFKSLHIYSVIKRPVSRRAAPD